MPDSLGNKDKKVKIVIYHGHIHNIMLSEDIKDKKQNLIEKNIKNSEERFSVQ